MPLRLGKYCPFRKDARSLASLSFSAIRNDRINSSYQLPSPLVFLLSFYNGSSLYLWILKRGIFNENFVLNSKNTRKKNHFSLFRLKL